MTTMANAARAYRRSSDNRSLRAQEADVFRRATGALRAASDATSGDRTRALIDNQRLWNMVVCLVRDPDNQLQPIMRATLVSVGMAVQREMDGPSPDFNFLIAVNEIIAAGLEP
jgi:flagellar biosynthesis activator protein FlaF